MDDQTEVPEEPQYRVRYQDEALPMPSYTRPMSKPQAEERRSMMEGMDGLSKVLVIPAEQIAEETAPVYKLEGRADEQAMLRESEARRREAQEQITEDVDASLGEPTDDEVRAVLPSTTEIDTWSQKQNRHTALDHAMALAKVPLGGMIVQTGCMDANDIVKTARVFLAFLNEEGTGA